MKRFYSMENLPESKKLLVERNPELSGVSLINPHRTNKFSPTDLVGLAKDIQNADTFIRANACNKLQIIAQQVRFLQQQAQNVLVEAKLMTELHHTPCNFVKVPGNIYHLYKRPSGQKYFGMIGPNEWKCPHEYLGSFRLEHDQSWTPVDKIKEHDDEFCVINKILCTSSTSDLMALKDAPMEM